MGHARLTAPARPITLRASLVLAVLTSLAACSSSPPPPAEAAAPPAPTEAPAEGPAATPAPMGTVVRSDAQGAPIPDDYVLTPRDCSELGKQYGAVHRNDQRAKLSPKLSAKQREEVEENIDRVVNKLVEQWVEGCMTQLAGKNVDPKSLKCVNTAKSVKDFDVCLNGEPPAQAPENKK